MILSIITKFAFDYLMLYVFFDLINVNKKKN